MVIILAGSTPFTFNKVLSGEELGKEPKVCLEVSCKKED